MCTALLPPGVYPIAVNKYIISYRIIGKGKAVQLQTWSGPEGSSKLRLPDYVTTAQDGGKFVNLTHRPSLPPGNAPGTHFCYRLSRPQGHSAIGRIMSMKNSNDTFRIRTSDLPICSTALTTVLQNILHHIINPTWTGLG